MDKFRLMNFRSIDDSGVINLKPITVFLGKNSCGKSSFIRMLPLLKQSLEKEKQEPLLWYGDYVDFGSFEEILPKNGKRRDSFILEFNVDLLNNNDNGYYFGANRWMFYDDIMFRKNDETIIANVKVEFEKKYIKSIEVNYLDNKVMVLMEKYNIKKITINQADMGNDIYKMIFTGHGLLPEMFYSDPRDKRELIWSGRTYSGINSIADLLIEITRAQTKIENLRSFVRELLCLQTKSRVLEKLRYCSNSKKIRDYFKDKSIEDENFIRIYNKIQLILLPRIIEFSNLSVKNFLDNLYYIKPIRANANRYYRIQGIGVKKVDADGNNLPMVLYNLPKSKQKEFSDWCKENLGISFSVKESEGHISLMVKASDGYDINIADCGYGYSQVLPIILQFWLLTNFNNKKDKRGLITDFSIVIEQPELHLHPAFQSKLIDVFASFIEAVNKDGNKVKIIFETHSDVMVNRLGVLVSQKKISKDDINIVLVQKKDGVSNFKQVNYNNEGLINEWPIGFMSPED